MRLLEGSLLLLGRTQGSIRVAMNAMHVARWRCEAPLALGERTRCAPDADRLGAACALT